MVTLGAPFDAAPTEEREPQWEARVRYEGCANKVFTNETTRAFGEIDARGRRNVRMVPRSSGVARSHERFARSFSCSLDSLRCVSACKERQTDTNLFQIVVRALRSLAALLVSHSCVSLCRGTSRIVRSIDTTRRTDIIGLTNYRRSILYNNLISRLVRNVSPFAERSFYPLRPSVYPHLYSFPLPERVDWLAIMLHWCFFPFFFFFSSFTYDHVHL